MWICKIELASAANASFRGLVLPIFRIVISFSYTFRSFRQMLTKMTQQIQKKLGRYVQEVWRGLYQPLEVVTITFFSSNKILAIHDTQQPRGWRTHKSCQTQLILGPCSVGSRGLQPTNFMTKNSINKNNVSIWLRWSDHLDDLANYYGWGIISLNWGITSHFFKYNMF